MKPKGRSNIWVLCILWMYLLGWNCHCDHSEMEPDGLSLTPPRSPLNHIGLTPLTPPHQLPIKSTILSTDKTDSNSISTSEGASDGSAAASGATVSVAAFLSSEAFSGSDHTLIPTSVKINPVDSSVASSVPDSAADHSGLPPAATGSLSPPGSARQPATEPKIEAVKVVPMQSEAGRERSAESVPGTLPEQDPVSDTAADVHQRPAVPAPQVIQEPVQEAAATETQGDSMQPKVKLGETAEEGTAKTDESQPVGGEPPASEVMPSFDEWKKMMLAEQEKGGQKVLPPYTGSGKKILSMKRRRNYASYECGAKIVSSNPEAESTGRILNELVDEYMLNPCIAKIWFVIELCESIQASQIELANFELFSSSPKDFTVYWSDRFPTRDWTPLGSFIATDQKTLQSFDLNKQGFGKFIKVEMGSHYGTEHYCPLSVVRVFGASMVEEYEELETQEHTQPAADDEEDDHTGTTLEDLSSSSKNLFGSARDAVLSIVKKAAQAWTRDQDQVSDENITSGEQTSTGVPETTTQCESFSDSNNCTKLNKTQEGGKEEVQLPAEELDPSAAERPVPELPLPQLQHCILCTSVPKVDKEQSHAEPDEGCRFLQAALGPEAYDAACDQCRRQVLAASVLPSSTQHSETSGCQPAVGSVSHSSLASQTSRDTPAMSASRSSEDSASTSATGARHASTDMNEATSGVVPTASGKHRSATLSPQLPAGNDDAVDRLQELRGSIQPTSTVKDPLSAKPDRAVPSSVPADSAPHVPVAELSSVPHLESSSGMASGGSVVGESTETLPSTEPVLSPLPSASDASQPLDFQETVDVKVSREQLPSHQAPETAQHSSGLPAPHADGLASNVQGTVQETLTQPKILASRDIPDELIVEDKNGKLPTVAPTEPPTTWTAIREPVGTIPKDARTIHPSPTVVTPQKSDYTISGTALPPGQKESVFMRLSNRLKALELNMSLSSQYLEELSQRYRRQMEEMQRAFNRTVGTLNDTARKAAERDLQQQETIGHLEAQLANISMAVDILMTERHTLHTQLLEKHLFLVAVEVIVLVTVLSLCVRRMSQAANRPVVRPASESAVRTTEPRRRNSANDSLLCSKGRPPDLKRHYSSDDTLHSGSYQELMIIEPAIPIIIEPPPKVKKKNRSKKNKGLVRSASTQSLRSTSDRSLSSQGDVSQPKPSQRCISSAGVLFAAPTYLGNKDKPLHNGAPNGSVRPFTCDVYPDAFDGEPSDSSKAGGRDPPAKSVPNGLLANRQAPGAARLRPVPPEKFSLKKFLKSF